MQTEKIKILAKRLLALTKQLKHVLPCLILCAIGASLCAATLLAEESSWLRWSGPRGDFVSSETDWSHDWPEDGLQQIWKAEIGTGFSSVTIASGLLYTMGRSEDEDVVYCLDANTGEEKWRFKYPALLFDNLHEGGPGATPTIDGDHVYTLSRDGKLFCFNRIEGAVVWSANVGETVGIDPPEWGFSASPLIVDEKLLVEAGRIVAFDKTSGKEIWQTKTKYRPGYGSPVAFEHQGKKLVTSLNNDVLQVVQLNDGEEFANFPWKTSFATSASTPIVSGDTIFISTGYGQGCVLVQLKEGELSKIYAHQKLANHMNNCVFRDGLLFGIHGNAHNARTCTLVCMDHATGEVKWSERGYGCGSLMAAGDWLLVLSDQGKLACVQATPAAHQELASAEVLDGKCWTVPVLLDGKVYCRNAAGTLVCVALPEK